MADTPQDQAQGPSAQPELTNTLFPPPPAYYKAFTAANLARQTSLAGPSGTSKQRGGEVSVAQADGTDIGGEIVAEAEIDELRKLSAVLDPPNVDWVVQEGRWKCFGETYTVDSKIATAEEIGVPPWVDPTETPQTTLPPLLHSFLHTLMLLLEVLTKTAPTPGELNGGHTGAPYIEHLCNLAATMMVATNQLRGAQAEATMVLLMEKQVETRRAQSEALRRKSRAIAATMQKLRNASKELESATSADAMEVDGESRKGVEAPA